MNLASAKMAKPAIVWFKAQAPGIRNDGSSLVTMRLAEALAREYDIHLVCLRTPWTKVDPSSSCVPPFASVVIAETPHQQSPMHRLLLGARYWLLDRAGRRPAATSIEGARSIVRRVAAVVEHVGAVAGVVEYWSARNVLSSMPAGRSTLILHDVEHIAASHRTSSRRKMILQEELAACNAADRVVFLSDEDRSMFADLGFAGGATAFVPVTDAAPLREETHAASKVVCLGHLDWAPNQRGLSWFLEEVWPEVRRRRPDVELLVVGRSLGMTDGAGVTYTGYVDDLLATLRLADVGIVPTLDGTGVKTKTLDLLAAGMPLVATTNGVRGTSAATAGALIADDPDGFTEHLLSLLGDGELRASLSRAGRSALRLQHSQTAVADRLVR